MNSIDKKNTYIFYSLGIVSIFIIWLFLSLIINNQFAVPKVNDTFKALGDLMSTKNTYYILGKTILRILLTIAIAFITSIILVGLSTLSKRFRAFII